MHHATIGQGHQSSDLSGADVACWQQLQDNPNFEGGDIQCIQLQWQHAQRDQQQFCNMLLRQLQQNTQSAEVEKRETAQRAAAQRHCEEEAAKRAAAQPVISSQGGQGDLEGGLGGCGQAGSKKSLVWGAPPLSQDSTQPSSSTPEGALPLVSEMPRRYDDHELFLPDYEAPSSSDSEEGSGLSSVVPLSVKSSGILWLNCLQFASFNPRSQCVSAVNLSHVGVETPKGGFAVSTQTPKGGFAVSTESSCSAVNLSHVGVKTPKRGFPSLQKVLAVQPSILRLKQKSPKVGYLSHQTMVAAGFSSNGVSTL
jgi:hypothetical protein